MAPGQRGLVPADSTSTARVPTVSVVVKMRIVLVPVLRPRATKLNKREAGMMTFDGTERTAGLDDSTPSCTPARPSEPKTQTFAVDPGLRLRASMARLSCVIHPMRLFDG